MALVVPVIWDFWSIWARFILSKVIVFWLYLVEQSLVVTDPLYAKDWCDTEEGLSFPWLRVLFDLPDDLDLTELSSSTELVTKTNLRWESAGKIFLKYFSKLSV